MVATKPENHRILKLKKGDFLFKQDETSQDFYIVKSGTIRIFRVEGQKEITLDMVRAGMFTGEIASLDGGTRTASGVAAGSVEVIVIPRDEFKQIFTAIPEWFRKIALILVKRLRDADEKISRAASSDYTTQVVELLSLIVFSEKAVKTDRGYEIDQKFLEYEIMDMLAIPLAEIENIMERLAEKGLVSMADGFVIIEKREKLEVAAG